MGCAGSQKAEAETGGEAPAKAEAKAASETKAAPKAAGGAAPKDSTGGAPPDMKTAMDILQLAGDLTTAVVEEILQVPLNRLLVVTTTNGQRRAAPSSRGSFGG